MNELHLINTAKSLNQVSISAYNEYLQKSESLVAKINAILTARPEIEDLVGKNNVNMMKDNHNNHVRFIASILKNHNPDILVNTVLWVFRAYRSHGFTSNYWAVQLNTWINILKEELSPNHFQEIYPYYEWMQINIPIFTKVSEEKLIENNNFH